MGRAGRERVVSHFSLQANTAQLARLITGRHAAGLDFGDLFAYALARTSGEPLLFKGEDFARTDVSRVV